MCAYVRGRVIDPFDLVDGNRLVRALGSDHVPAGKIRDISDWKPSHQAPWPKSRDAVLSTIVASIFASACCASWCGQDACATFTETDWCETIALATRFEDDLITVFEKAALLAGVQTYRHFAA